MSKNEENFDLYYQKKYNKYKKKYLDLIQKKQIGSNALPQSQSDKKKNVQNVRDKLKTVTKKTRELVKKKNFT